MMFIFRRCFIISINKQTIDLLPERNNLINRILQSFTMKQKVKRTP
jgi:hypothetical protein